MTNLLNRRRLMMVICLVATLALAACGDDNGSNNGSGNNGGNNGADAGDQDTGDQDTGDQDSGDQDGGDEDTNGGGGGCDINGFTAPTGMQIEETSDSWSLYGETGDQVMELSLSKDGGATGTGTFTFEDVALDQMDNLLFMADGCGDQGCEGIYVATAGSVEITTWESDVDGGDFEATFSNLELAEVDGNFEFVDGGQTWCVDSFTASATVDLMVPFPETVTCDNDGFTAAADTLSAEVSEGGPFFVQEANADAAPREILSLEIFPGFDGAATSAGTYQLDDWDFATCANCLLIRTDCGDDTTCEPKTFIAGEGALEITSAGTVDGAFTVDETFSATLTDAKLVEVIIAQDLSTEIVEDGEGWCIDSYTWDSATITAAPTE